MLPPLNHNDLKEHWDAAIAKKDSEHVAAIAEKDDQIAKHVAATAEKDSEHMNAIAEKDDQIAMLKLELEREQQGGGICRC